MLTQEQAALEKQQACNAASQAIAFIQTVSTRPIAQMYEGQGLPFVGDKESVAYDAACEWLARYWAEWT